MSFALRPVPSSVRRRAPSAAAALAAVGCTLLFTVSVPVTDGAGAVGHGTAASPVALRHARQCASVRRSTPATIVVAVVIDTGDDGATAEVSCVPVPTGSNGAQVLAARATLLGVPAPRDAESGLLCAIDGYPATGCGQEVGGHYAYWAYYHGGSSWTYASGGPASWLVSPGDVEGWRYQPQGSATPADPPPRSSSEASALCPASGPPPTTTTTTASPPTTGPSTTVPVASSPTGGDGGGSSPATRPAGAVGTATAGENRPSPTTVSTTAPPPPTATTTPRRDGRHRPGHRTGSRTRRRGPCALKAGSAGHGNGPIGILIGVAVIALLAAGAFVRSRRLTRAR